MSSTRPRAARRVAQPPPSPSPALASPRARRTGRRGRVEPSPSPELRAEEEDADEDEGTHDDAGGSEQDAEGEEEDGEGEEEENDLMEAAPPAAAPSGRSRGRARGGARGRGRRARVGRVKVEKRETEDEDDAEEVRKRMRKARKSVSYKEIPAEVEEEEGEEDAEGEEDVDMDGGSELTPAPAEPLSARKRGRPPKSKDKEELEDPPFKREKIGSGRGGFSVKGAAAAAARARWDKVRRERAERGEESDEGEKRRPRGAGRKESKVTAETVAMDSTVTIKGREYLVGDDELILPEDPKGNLKIDAEGRLLGGREYKLVTFTSPTRRNPNRVYALTIDAARACGYTDSLAFLRRCPQIIKLGCNPEERQMLIDIGRVTGNLKNRMVTLVAMRNVFKLMGTRVIKGGKWVTDDYFEEESLVKCQENGFTPYAPAVEDDIIANAMSQMQPQGRPPVHDREPNKTTLSLAPFYTLGGPTTHFAGSGADPWSEAGWGNKRGRLRGQGVSEEDWMLRTAEESRKVDERLREYREERLVRLEGKDARRWVFATQKWTEEGEEERSAFEGDGDRRDGDVEVDAEGEADGEEGAVAATLKPPPAMGSKRSALSQEVTFKAEDEEMAFHPAEATQDEPGGDGDGEVAADNGVVRTEGGKIVVQSAEEEEAARSRWNWGLGSWESGVVLATYEPHTHTPHVPLHTQPSSANPWKLSPHPILSSQADEKHRNFAQSSITGPAARGLASVEYVLEPAVAEHGHEYGFGYEEWMGGGVVLGVGEDERERRGRMVREAEEWEREARRRRVQAQSAA